MSTSNLALLIFVMTVALFIASFLSRNPGKNEGAIKLIMRILGVLIIVFTIIYFRMRLAA